MADNYIEGITNEQDELKRLRSLLEAERMLTSVSSEYTAFGLWEYDIANDVYALRKKANGDYLESPEYTEHFRETLIGHGSVFSEDLPEFNRFCDSLERGDNEVFCEIRMVGEAPGIVWLRFEGKAVFDENDRPVKIIGRSIDVTQEKGGTDLSFGRRDPLTGLYSPEVFRDVVLEKRSGINRYNNGAFLSIGVDNFRDIEAVQGREYSDYVQKCVAKIITEVLSSERDSAVTRIRSGEFLTYVSYLDTTAPDYIAKRLLDEVNLFAFDGEPAKISIGISRMRSGGRVEDVYGRAALALGEAHRSGGNCYMHYSITMSSSQTVSADSEAMSSAGGVAKVYELIIRAFCSSGESTASLRAAFKAAGEFVGASNIYVYPLDADQMPYYMTYNATGLKLDDCPRIIQQCSNSDISAVFGEHDSVRIHSADDKITGLALDNGAICAECRAIRYKGKVAEYFVVVFNSSFELTEQDLQVITALQNAMTAMYTSYEENRAGEIVRQLRSTIISDHRMEGFSIIPGTFVVDVVGENAAEHYNLKPGDICYKKSRGRDTPCENCPALRLDHSSELFASSAYYNEKDGRWLDITASVGENNFGERRYIVSSTDITDCLGKIQMTDSLTGVMAFDAFTAEALRRSASGNYAGFIAVISFAEFRRVNERLGFEMGNSILISVAKIMASCLSGNELICRNNASRFILLFEGDDDNELFVRLSSMLTSIQKQIFDKYKIQIYMLAGVAAFDDEINVMGALDRGVAAKKTVSDRAYYNRNHIVFYDGTLSQQVKERRLIEANMMDALENDEFKVYYQPKVRIDNGRVSGAEALVRWFRPDGEMISPGKFVPIFEENGFITDMDFAIYRSAISDIARWLKQGIEVPLISLNVSRFHLSDENFCVRLNDLVDHFGVPHKYIELEITESLLTENLERLIQTVMWLKTRGYRISVDDFGSGYSSLNLITQLPFDTLKIDGAFFLKNELTDRNKKVITSVVTLAKSLNLETISEGVETQEQVDFLRELGCDMIQGYFYYKPMPSADFEKLLNEGK